MGLGKTLSMIALVATDLPEYQKDHLLLERLHDEELGNNTTLVVVPPPRKNYLEEEDRSLLMMVVLDTWEEQLSQ